ncbi:MAG: undecaprenyldiphospho-muramoylpentapeptide beta-N-acetylglucosaminyltransferase [Bacteroidales bacterium]|nr:undecaprenyldiphospho-muramoylpentapeptide beta-N-acetylglucosaminyltransferase [Bacteroidales bacterium]
MQTYRKHIKAIISGGGTGGHIFPAISIANELKRQNSSTEILFVGAIGRMEMERIPAAGYKIEGLPVSGFQRKLSYRNFGVLINLIKSLSLAGKILKRFKPDIAIGVGGYASGPIIYKAAKMNLPCIIQEQNSYAGITNKLLARKVSKICVAYSNMEKYFPADKIVLTGNPVRNIEINEKLKNEAYEYFGLHKDIPVIVVVGGSLGARTFNESLIEKKELLQSGNLQVIWQTGKYYYEKVKNEMHDAITGNIHIYDFISRMDLVYNIADLMISRAGAISISEICLTGRAAILVPSPNVAEDHQTRNALALTGENAAIMITDKEAREKLIPTALEIINNKELLMSLSSNSKKLAKPNATKDIVNEILKLTERINES